MCRLIHVALDLSRNDAATLKYKYLQLIKALFDREMGLHPSQAAPVDILHQGRKLYAVGVQGDECVYVVSGMNTYRSRAGDVACILVVFLGG
jgi:hypothetical protein